MLPTGSSDEAFPSMCILVPISPFTQTSLFDVRQKVGRPEHQGSADGSPSLPCRSMARAAVTRRLAGRGTRTRKDRVHHGAGDPAGKGVLLTWVEAADDEHRSTGISAGISTGTATGT